MGIKSNFEETLVDIEAKDIFLTPSNHYFDFGLLCMDMDQ